MAPLLGFEPKLITSKVIVLNHYTTAELFTLPKFTPNIYNSTGDFFTLATFNSKPGALAKESWGINYVHILTSCGGIWFVIPTIPTVNM